MLKSQALAIEINKLNIEINKLPFELRSDDPHLELRRSERETKQKELMDLQQRQGQALESEAAKVDADFSAQPAESAELRQLIDRARSGSEFGAAFDAVVNKRHVPAGAVSELQEERGLPGHLLPLDLIMEQRASITGLTDSPSQPQAFRPYVFPASVGAFMGFEFPRVAYGTPSFPVLTTPVTVHTPAEGSDATETTGVIAADALTPQRTQGSLRYSREDAARFAMLGDAVRSHVSEAYASAVDQRCLTDTTSGLLSITQPNDPGSQTGFDDYIGALVGKIDGQYGRVPMDVRMIVGTKTAEHMVVRYKTNTAPTSAYRAMLDLVGNEGLRVAHGIPAPVSSDQAAFSVGMVGAPHAVAPQWDGLEVLADPYSSSVKGEIAVTIVGHSALKILRTDAYTRHRFQLA